MKMTVLCAAVAALTSPVAISQAPYGERAISAQSGGASITLRSYQVKPPVVAAAPTAFAQMPQEQQGSRQFGHQPAPATLHTSEQGRPLPPPTVTLPRAGDSSYKAARSRGTIYPGSDTYALEVAHLQATWSPPEVRREGHGTYVSTRQGDVLIPNVTWASDVNRCHNLTRQGVTPLDRQARSFLLGLRMSSAYRSSPGSLSYNELMSAIDQERDKVEATLLTCQVVVEQSQ